jgi:ribonuclease D
MAIHFYENDLPQNHTLTGERIAVDCEAMGLNTRRDRPCLVQLSSGDGEAHLVKIDVEHFPTNLMAVLTNPDQVKIMHLIR